jgi:hypothetical protein
MESALPEADYTKGFNDGYIMTKHLPELSEKLSGIDSDVPRIDGFKEGRKQFVLDKARETREQWRSQDKGHPRQSDKSKGKDIDRE